jgi:hypothetical protein
MGRLPCLSRSSGPRYGYNRLRDLEAEINAGENQRLIFANSQDLVEGELANSILNEAEKRSGLATNAVTARKPSTGEMILVFRNRNVTRAEVLEELRHLEQPRLGLWNVELPGLTPFQVRELDVVAYFRNLLREGSITQAEFDETVRNLAHHLSTSETEALRIVEGLSP